MNVGNCPLVRVIELIEASPRTGKNVGKPFGKSRGTRIPRAKVATFVGAIFDSLRGQHEKHYK